MYRIYIGNSKVKLLCNGDEIEYKFDGLNETRTLLSGDEVNQIMGRKLTEISMRNVPLFNKKEYFLYNQDDFHKPQFYFKHFENLKNSKKPFSLIITRYDYEGKSMFKTCLKVTLESYSIKESAENGNNCSVNLCLKKWVNYENRKLKQVTTNTDTGKTTAKVTVKKRESTKEKQKTYVVKSGDTLGKIAKSTIGNTKYWTSIYSANKATIESTAKKNGRLSSSKGKYLYIGTKLIIPDV